jgi:hypothetical protein
MTITRGLVIGTAAAEPPDEEEELIQGVLWDGATGVNEWYWNAHTKLQWKVRRGDWLDATQTSQGATPFSTVTVTATGAEQNVTITGLASLVQRWLDGTNRGMFLRGATGGGDVNLYSRHDATSSKWPTLTVTASISGTTVCACTADSTLEQSLGNGWDENENRVYVQTGTSNVVMQFDLSGVEGTVSAAQLNLVSSNTFAPNTTIQVMEIDCPTIWTGDTAGQTVETGLANNTYWDSEINAQSGVYYARPHDAGYLQDFFKWNGQGAEIVERASGSGALRNDNDAGFGNNPPFRYVDELRDWAVRGKFITTDSGSSDYKWFFDQTLTNNGPYPTNATDPEEAYVRIYMKLETDFLTTVDHMKGAVGFTTINGPSSDFGPGGVRADGSNGWRAHQHIGRYTTDTSNPYADLHFAGSYIYHMDQEGNFGDTAETGVDDAGFGTTSTRWGCGTSSGNRGGDGFPAFCYERDRWYCIEMRIRMNTVSSPATADGVLEVWVNGVKVFSKSTFRWRDTADLKIQSVYCNMYHGGTSPPDVEMHYQVTGFAVASGYVGPMRMEAEPAHFASTAGELKAVTPANAFSSLNPGVYPFATFTEYGDTDFNKIEDFSGSTFNPHFGVFGSMIIHGGGHASYFGNQVMAFDIYTRLYQLAHNQSPSILPSRNSGGSPTFDVMHPTANPDPAFDATNCEYGDGRPAAAHTYDDQVILPPWIPSAGSKGALLRTTSSAAHPRMSRETGRSHRFRFSVEDWDRYSTNALARGSAVGGCCDLDTRRNRVWYYVNDMSGLDVIKYLNLLTATHVQISGIATPASPSLPGNSPVMRYDSERDLIMLVYTASGGSSVIIQYMTGLGNATPTGWLTATLSQNIPPQHDSHHPLAYVPDVDRWFMLAPAVTDGCYEIQIPSTPASTWTVTKRDFSGVTTIQTKYTAGKRWEYSRKAKNIFWHGDISLGGDPHLYRPHGVSS